MSQWKLSQLNHIKMHWKYLFAFSWLAFTISLLTWWIFVIQDLLERVGQGDPDVVSRLPNLQNMVFWEGISLILLIVIGAIPIIYLIYRERSHYLKLQQFFATFSHDLKTAMASLVLQTESLKDEVNSLPSSENKMIEPLTDRILTDAGRLHLQLENSLFFSHREERKYFFEELQFSKYLEALKFQWPQFKIELEGDAHLKVDRRAFESIFNNLCQNASQHGQATTLKLIVDSNKEGWVNIQFLDDGIGFSASRENLGKPFVRHSNTSGSGMGLYIVREALEALNGDIKFLESEKGFLVEITLPTGIPTQKKESSL